MKGYKAFEKGMICRGKQYAENTIFEEESAEICKKGMHFCKNPLDVLDYYPFVNGEGDVSEFAEVEALDDAETDDGKKYVTKKLKVGAKLTFADLIEASLNIESEECVEVTTADEDDARINSSNDDAKINSSGDWAEINSSGNYTIINSSGDHTIINSSGYDTIINSPGLGARINSSGDHAEIASSGDLAEIALSGNSTRINSSGDNARINSSGKDCIICCAGREGCVKAKIGSQITLTEWKIDDEKKQWVPVCVKTKQVDGERIKEDVFYILLNGEFVEV